LEKGGNAARRERLSEREVHCSDEKKFLEKETDLMGKRSGELSCEKVDNPNGGRQKDPKGKERHEKYGWPFKEKKETDLIQKKVVKRATGRDELAKRRKEL